MSRKRIAVLTARADDPEQKDVIVGIAEASLAEDADIVVYSNIYNHWTDDTLLSFENIIYSLFEPCYYDGAIITAEAFRDISVLSDVIGKLKKAKLPVVVIGGEIEGFASVYSDDGSDMERIAEHLITAHGYRNIDILTGSEGDTVSHKRAEGCKRAFKKYGIHFDDSKLHYGNFWNDSGEALAERYISGELSFPQAVICTNDFMAYGLCDALATAGISVPDRIAVTGYDYTGGRIYHYPLLTSYRRNRRKIGADAVNVLLGTAHKINSDDRIVWGNSCPCGTHQAQLNDELHSERIGKHHSMMNNVAQFSSRLTLCRTLAEYTAVLSEFYYLLHGTQRLCVCLDSAWSSAKYEGEEFICCEIDEQRASAPVRFCSIPPVLEEERDKPMVFFFTPICFQTRFFGYTVQSFSYPASYDFSFRDWSKTAADTLEFLRMKNDIHYLRQCQRESSMYDALTGFYNLREFGQIAETAGDNCSLLAVKLSFAADSDYLYGENFRSDIVSAVARAIKQACIGHEVCCRAYEDTFLVMCKGDISIPAERIRILLHNAVCRTYDERQVLVSIAELDSVSTEEACVLAAEKSRLSIEERSKRCKLQHYSALADIRSEVAGFPEKAPALSQVSKRMCVSEGYFRSVYKQCFGMSYNQDCINARVMKACCLLITTAMSVYAIAVSCGYEDEKYFARQFRQNMGYSPMQYRGKYCVQ